LLCRPKTLPRHFAAATLRDR
jgi:hypothetical protein